MVDAKSGATASTGGPADKLRVFISYSRKGALDFADQLFAALTATGFDPTLDRHGISGAEDWRQRLSALILEADTVVFVLSPEAAVSPICLWEVDEALRLGKRIVPIAAVPLGSVTPPEALAKLNYIFFHPEPSMPGASGFGHGLSRLIQALNTDLGWLREHTRLLQRATDWASAGRSANRLLTGSDIADVKAWLANRPISAPEATALHLDFLRASEQHEEHRLDSERLRLEEIAAAQAARDIALRQAEEAIRRRASLRLAAFAALSIVAALAGWQWWEARRAQEIAVAQRETAEVERARATEAARKATAERDRALVTQSQFLTDLATQRAAASDYTTSVLLALEALPDPRSPQDRPFVERAAESLGFGMANLRQTYLLGTPREQTGDLVDWTPPPQLSRDGSRILTSQFRLSTVWETATGEKLRSIPDDGYGRGAWLSPDGKFILRSFNEEQGKPPKAPAIIDVETGRTISTLGDLPVVSAAQFVRDGRMVAIAVEGVVHLYNVETGKLDSTIRRDGLAVSSLHASRDGSLLLLVDIESLKLTIWDVKQRQARTTIALPESDDLEAFRTKHGRSLGQAALNANGERVMVVVDDVAWVFASSDGHLISETKFNWRDVAGEQATYRDSWLPTARSGGQAKFSPDGKLLLITERGAAARIFDVDTSKELVNLGPQSEAPTAAAFSSDNEFVALASIGATRVYDLRSGIEIADFSGSHSDVQFTPDGRTIATASSDQAVRLWSVLPDQSSWLVRARARFTGNGDRLLVMQDGLAPQVFDATSGKRLSTPTRRDQKVTGFWLNGSGDRVATVSPDSSAQLWATDTGDLVTTLSGHSGPVNDAKFSYDDLSIVTASGDATARVWDAKSGRERLSLRGHTAGVRTATFSLSGRHLATWSDDRSIRIWDATTSQAVSTSKTEYTSVRQMMFDRAETILVVMTGQSIDFLRAATGETITSAQLGSSSLSTTKLSNVSPDLSRLAVALADNSIAIYDVSTGRETARLSGHLSSVNDLAFSPDGARIVSASDDHSARVWDAASGKQLALMADQTIVNAVAFDPRGARMLSASEDDTTKIWDATDGRLIATLGHPPADNRGGGLIRNPNLVGVVANETEGRLRVVTATSDKRRGAFKLELWDADSHHLISAFDTRLASPNLRTFDVHWNPSGSSVLVSGLGLRTDAFRIWATPRSSGELVERARAAVPRCLTAEERELYFLEAPPPDWCVRAGKPPYRYRLGAEFADAPAEGAAGATGNGKVGAQVKRVISGLPADKAGLQVADIVTSIAETAIVDTRSALAAIADLPSGRAARFGIWRGGELRHVDVLPRF